MSEVYHSSTHGPIPLSFTGRRLMAKLRDAINRAIEAQSFTHDDKAVSKARGEIAQYMSKLEARDEGGIDWSALKHAVRNTAVFKSLLSPEDQAAEEFLD